MWIIYHKETFRISSTWPAWHSAVHQKVVMYQSNQYAIDNLKGLTEDEWRMWKMLSKKIT